MGLGWKVQKRERERKNINEHRDEGAGVHYGGLSSGRRTGRSQVVTDSLAYIRRP